MQPRHHRLIDSGPLDAGMPRRDRLCGIKVGGFRAAISVRYEEHSTEGACLARACSRTPLALWRMREDGLCCVSSALLIDAFASTSLSTARLRQPAAR
jgi:hypothetical protein